MACPLAPSDGAGAAFSCPVSGPSRFGVSGRAAIRRACSASVQVEARRPAGRGRARSAARVPRSLVRPSARSRISRFQSSSSRRARTMVSFEPSPSPVLLAEAVRRRCCCPYCMAMSSSSERAVYLRLDSPGSSTTIGKARTNCRPSRLSWHVPFHLAPLPCSRAVTSIDAGARLKRGAQVPQDASCTVLSPTLTKITAFLTAAAAV